MPRLRVLDRYKDDEVLCPLLDVVVLQVEPLFQRRDVPAKVLRNGDRDPSRERTDLSNLWASAERNDADRCMHLLLRVHRLRDSVAAEVGRLLRLLLLRLGSLPANTSSATVLWLSEASVA